jgi:IS5 family transposase
LRELTHQLLSRKFMRKVVHLSSEVVLPDYASLCIVRLPLSKGCRESSAHGSPSKTAG